MHLLSLGCAGLELIREKTMYLSLWVGKQGHWILGLALTASWQSSHTHSEAAPALYRRTAGASFPALILQFRNQSGNAWIKLQGSLTSGTRCGSSARGGSSDKSSLLSFNLPLNFIIFCLNATHSLFVVVVVVLLYLILKVFCAIFTNGITLFWERDYFPFRNGGK